MRSGDGRDEIGDGVANPAAIVRVGDKEAIGIAMTEDAALEDSGLRTKLALKQMPIRTGFEERFHAVGRAPIEIVGSIAAIAEPSGDRNDALMLVIGQGHENVDNADACLCGCEWRRVGDRKECKKCGKREVFCSAEHGEVKAKSVDACLQ